MVSRTGYTGELGYEIWCHPRDAEKVFDAVWEAGQPHGLKPMGLQALDMVRIEAGLIFAGYEFSDQTDPFEAGIGFTVPLKTKTDDFIGREALIRRKENPQQKLVGLDIDANVDVGHGDCVHVGRAQIGVVTSGMRSPVLGKNIALARLDVAHAAIGTEVEIGKLDGHAKAAAGAGRRLRPLRSAEDQAALVVDVPCRHPASRQNSPEPLTLMRFAEASTLASDLARSAKRACLRLVDGSQNT